MLRRPLLRWRRGANERLSFRRKSSKKSDLTRLPTGHDRGNGIHLLIPGKYPNFTPLAAVEPIDTDKVSQLGSPSFVGPSRVEIATGPSDPIQGWPNVFPKTKALPPYHITNKAPITSHLGFNLKPSLTLSPISNPKPIQNELGPTGTSFTVITSHSDRLSHLNSSFIITQLPSPNKGKIK